MFRKVKQYYGAGMILYSYDAKGRLCVMLERRSEHVRQSGTWSIPGGGYDRVDGITGERKNLKQCAIRETFEETGIRVDPEKVWYVTTQKIPYFYEYEVYAVWLEKMVIRKTSDHESDEIAWFPVNQIPAECNYLTKAELNAFRRRFNIKEA